MPACAYIKLISLNTILKATGIRGKQMKHDLQLAQISDVIGAVQVIVLLLLCIGASGSIYAGDIYKWVDETGKTHFGESPPNDTATKLKIKEPNTIDPLKIVVPLTNQNSDESSAIPTLEFKGYYKDKKLRFHYRTVAGLRTNPTLEYYSWGDLKREVDYSENLLDVPIEIKNTVKITKISAVEEYFDSIVFKITYELYQQTDKSRLFFHYSTKEDFNTKSLRLVPGKNSGNLISALKAEISEQISTDTLYLYFYNHYKNSWSEVGQIKYIKVWGDG